jgi:hypothetical protein
MPFCPSCKYEYRLGISECPDCGVKLVDKLPDEPKPQNPAESKIYEDWTPIARLTSTQMAEMVLEALRAKDIPAVIQSGVGYFGFVGTQGLSGFAPVGGGYSLLVPGKYVTDAANEVKIILGDAWEKVKMVDTPQ